MRSRNRYARPDWNEFAVFYLAVAAALWLTVVMAASG